MDRRLVLGGLVLVVAIVLGMLWWHERPVPEPAPEPVAEEPSRRDQILDAVTDRVTDEILHREAPGGDR